MKLDEIFTADLKENLSINSLLKHFTNKDITGNKIIKQFIDTIYLKTDTIKLAEGLNNRKQEVKFCSKAKQEINTEFGQTLYWDYYKYVKENPIVNWNKETYILYGSKDNMQEQSIIQDFSNKFNCKLSILENGEHYFHTEKQLGYYKSWLDKTLR